MPLKLYRRGKIWHYRGTVAGRLLRGSTKTASKETAQRIAVKREQETWNGYLDPRSTLTFAQASMLYRHAEKSDRFLRKIEDYWRDTPVKEITPGAIRAAAISLYPNAGPATRNRQAIVPTQAVINHAAEHELCPRSRRSIRNKAERERAGDMGMGQIVYGGGKETESRRARLLYVPDGRPYLASLARTMERR